MMTSQTPGLALADYVLYLAARRADRPRWIDRYIDYFGSAQARPGQGAR